MSMKNSSDTIGNRTRDLSTCSVVPQPTAPPRAYIYIYIYMYIYIYVYIYIYIYIGLKEWNLKCISGTSQSRLHSNTLLYGVTDLFIRSRPRINNYKSRKCSLVCTCVGEYEVGWVTEDAKIRSNPFESTCGHGALCSADVAANMTGGTAPISVVKVSFRS